jgi:predicted aldo/keto reductase-like oxidoreductase
MQYRTNPKTGEKISALAFGCMRFNKDEKEVERQIRYAMEQGVNYFDTAYIYPNSEATLGRILAKDGMRQKVNIATKLPHNNVRKYGDLDRIFGTQMERLQTDHIDYYLIHMLGNVRSWKRLTELGIEKWIDEKKTSGAIRNLGFSFHGSQNEFLALLEEYNWDFCMIQYNYCDENNQAGMAGLKRAGEKGIPVMIMEPLRGGTLANPKTSIRAIWEQADVKRSPAEWGFRWVLNHPQVLTVLSGMNQMEQIEENVRTFSDAEAGSLTEAELEVYEKVKAEIQRSMKVPCTGCGYCMPCPKGVDIPSSFSALNDAASRGRIMSKAMYIMTTGGNSASQCIKCGKCQTHCPQSIPIPEKLEQVKKELEGITYKPMRYFIRRFLGV